MIISENFIKTVRTFESLCLEQFKGDIDTLIQYELFKNMEQKNNFRGGNDTFIPEEKRKNRLGYFTREKLSDYLVSTLNEPIEYFLMLVKTPRLLKTILRRTMHDWDILHGEIDFHDILIANAIRFAAPEAYDFILENFREIRGLQHEGMLKDKEKRNEHLQAKWNDITDGVTWDVTSAEELLVFLFPMWNIQSNSSLDSVPQGVRHSEPTDYWLRFNIGELQNDEVRDQDVLKALRRWKENPDTDHFQGISLPEALFKYAQLAPKFEQFAKLFLDGKDFRRLSSSLFTIMLAEQGAKSNKDGCEGFIPLWRLAIRTPIDEKEHNDWILKEILSVLPKSLRFANDLYYFWKNNSESEIDSKPSRPGLRNPIIKEAKCLFGNSPKRFIECLDPDFMYSAFHFSIRFSHADEGGTEFNPIDWRWFSFLLVEAARIAPSVVIPQIVPLIFKEKMDFPDRIQTFDEKLATELFAERLPEVMTLIAQPFDYKRFSENEMKGIEYACKTAKDWLKNRNSSDI